MKILSNLYSDILLYMKVINQSILSTKHLLTTNSEVIEFNDEFHHFFNLLGGEINPIVNDNPYVDNIEDYAIYIDPEDMVKLEEQDYDSLFNTCIANGRFYIRNMVDTEAEDILIQSKDEKEMFLTEDALELMRKGKGLIHFKDLDDDYKIFEMVINTFKVTLYRNIQSKTCLIAGTSHVDNQQRKSLDNVQRLSKV